MTDSSSSPAEVSLADVLAAVNGLRAEVAAGFAASVERDHALADRLVKRTELLRAEIAGVKAELAIGEAYGEDTVTALQRHVADPNAHGGLAAA